MQKKHRLNFQTVTPEDMHVRAYYPAGYTRRRWIKFQKYSEIVDSSYSGIIDIYKDPNDDLPNPEYLVKFNDIKYNQVVYTLHIGKVKLEERITYLLEQIDRDQLEREEWLQRRNASNESP